MSHDGVNDLLRQKRFMPREVWRLVKDRIDDSEEAFLSVDDSGPDKRYSRFSELVGAQYRGNAPRGVRGSGVVRLGHSAGQEGDCDPIDYRVSAPEVEGKTKNEHLHALCITAVDHTQLQARTLLCDGWYASAANVQLRHRRQGTGVTTLKSKRWVRLSKAQGSGQLAEIDWTSARLAHGVSVKLKEVPFTVRVFTLVAPNGAIDWVMTTDLAETVTAQVAEASSAVRWQVEELHRDLKQLTGSEKCQGRLARAPRTHLACCSHAWVSLKVKAKEVGPTMYELRNRVFSNYLRPELRNPRIVAC